MTTSNIAPASITLPTLAEGATLKLVDPRPQADASAPTKKGRPVDAVCVDHAIVETGKGTAAVRLLWVILSGQDEQDRDMTGQNIVTDKYLSPNAAPYTLADLRLMGWAVQDGKEEEALGLVADGDIKKSGLGSKVLRVDLKSDNFNGQPVVRVAGISQPPQKLDAASAKSKLGAGLLDAIKKSKEGRPAFEGGAKGTGGTSQPRNPTSPPPAVQAGTASKVDEPLPF